VIGRQFRKAVVDQLGAQEIRDIFEEKTWPAFFSFLNWGAPRVRTRTVLQMEAAECGPAALAMVFAFYGLFVPLEKLRQECGVTRDGTNAARLVAIAKKHGFCASGFRKEPEELAELPLPAILHWNFDHFVVLEGIDSTRAWINDPARGRRTLSRSEFDRFFTGPVLVFEPGSKFCPQGRPTRILFLFSKWCAASKTALAVLFLIGAALIVPGLIVAQLLRDFVDQVLSAHRSSLVFSFVVGMLLISLARGLLTYFQREILGRVSNRLVTNLSTDYLRHALRLPYSFFVARHPADLVSRVEVVDRLSWLLSGDLPSAALSALMAIAYMVLMLMIDVRLSSIVLLFAAIMILSQFLSAPVRSEKAAQVTHERTRWMSLTASGLQAIETLKANGMEDSFMEKWLSHGRRAVLHQRSFAFLSESLSLQARFLQALCMLATLGLGAERVMDGSMSIGALIAFQSLAASSLGPIVEVVGFALRLDEIRAQVECYRDVLNHPVESALSPCSSGLPELAGDVEFRNVSFGYASLGAPIVKDLNLRAAPGARIGIVGRTGSGKSTVARLASGLLLPTTGQILFGGIDRQRYTNQLKGFVSSVEQEIHLFEGTLHDNVTLWNPSISQNAIDQAIYDACLEDLISSLPKGLDTPLFEAGKNLSGGERQRLELARALARNPAILILDEATSALDVETEKRVYERLRKRGCTCIIVAHRLSAIRDCDEILLFEQGQVTERGRHEELWEMGGRYRQLVETEQELDGN
jgi:NHLM bacteriocin system ABC transporter peptidase/ATP-binding protein